MQKIILDTDIGCDIDDALALGMIIQAGEILDLLGVTIVHDNVDMKARLAAKILQSAGLQKIPVLIGSALPLKEPLVPDKIKAQGKILSPQETFPSILDRSAPDFLYETCRKFPGEIIVIAIGPLTNIANTLQKFPDFFKYVKRLVIMGGAVKKDFAEYNIKIDPEAADIVFSSGMPLYIVPLDITEKCAVDDLFLSRIDQDQRPLQNLLSKLIHLWQTGYKVGCPVLHDPLAVGFLTAPSLYQFTPMDVDIKLESDKDRGRTIVKPNPESHIRICSGVDYSGFLEHFAHLLFIYPLCTYFRSGLH